MRRLQIIYNRAGFSLVELMVVIALIGIISGFGTPALLSMKAKSSVRADARDVYSALRHAQTEAVKRNEIIRIEFNSPGPGDYRIFIDNGGGIATNADNGIWDAGEPILAVKQLRAGSSFAGITFPSNPGYNSRGLPATTEGSVEIHSPALKMQLSISNAGFIKSTVI